MSTEVEQFLLASFTPKQRVKLRQLLQQAEAEIRQEWLAERERLIDEVQAAGKDTPAGQAAWERAEQATERSAMAVGERFWELAFAWLRTWRPEQEES